jgi:hypothetical protein
LRRHELEHAIRVSTEIVQQDTVIIIGSQSVLGTWNEEELPDEATLSGEVDIAPMHDDDAESLATKLDGVVGELSAFHESHGYYVQGVGRKTAVLPDGWEDRLVPVKTDWTNGGTGFCLDPVDLCIAKLVAHRDKDFSFVGALLEAGLVDAAQLRERIDLLPASTDRRSIDAVTGWVTSWQHAHPR